VLPELGGNSGDSIDGMGVVENKYERARAG